MKQTNEVQRCKCFFLIFFNMLKLCEYGQEVNHLLLMMNFYTFKNISVFRVLVKSVVEPKNNKSVFKLIGKLMV